jgi:hypothetical protein
MLSNHYYQNVVSLTLSGEKDTGSAGKQPASDNLTDWNGQGGQKSPYNYFTIPRNYSLENPTTNRSKKKEKTTIVKLKKGQHISGQDIVELLEKFEL